MKSASEIMESLRFCKEHELCEGCMYEERCDEHIADTLQMMQMLMDENAAAKAMVEKLKQSLKTAEDLIATKDKTIIQQSQEICKLSLERPSNRTEFAEGYRTAMRRVAAVVNECGGAY